MKQKKSNLKPLLPLLPKKKKELDLELLEKAALLKPSNVLHSIAAVPLK